MVVLSYCSCRELTAKDIATFVVFMLPMEQGNVYIGRCSQMKANMSPKSTDDDNVASTDMAEDGTCTDWRYNACIEPFWKQYSYITSWISTCQRNFSLSPCKPDFRDWCRLMTRYHAMMADYVQWNYLSMMSTTPQQLGYDWHNAAFLQNMMHSRPTTPSKFCNKCGRGRRRRKRRTKAQKQTGFSSGDIELHIANIDPDGCGLDVELGDGNDNMEFEFEITEDLIEFFAETARHRKQRGLICVHFCQCYFLFLLTA